MLAGGGLAAGWRGFPEDPEQSSPRVVPSAQGRVSVIVTDQSYLSVLISSYIACTAGAGLSIRLSISLWVRLGKNPRKAPGVEGGRQRWDLSVGLDLKP